jgi:hypothetical protein
MRMDGLSPSEILTNQKEWYSHTFIKLEIVKSLLHRELAILSPKGILPKKCVRYLLAFSVDYLDKHIHRWELNKDLCNLYMSVAVTKDIPVFSYNLQKRREEYAKFRAEYLNHIVGYDLFIDMDGKEDFEDCYKETSELKKLFEDYQIPYWIMNSSRHGFHIHIPNEYMPQTDIQKTILILNSLIYNLKGIYDFKTLDDSVVDFARICKVPYSFVNDNSVCLPLTDEQFTNFNQELITPENVLKFYVLKNRGVLIRKYGLNDEQLKKNVVKFIKEFSSVGL